MAYDSKTRTTILFGGEGPGGGLDDTWSFTGRDWTDLVLAQSPSARWDATMAYDPEIGKLVLFGGYGGTVLRDTWTFDGVTWTRLSPPESPPARANASMSYDPVTGTLILFGGWLGGGLSDNTNDTWSFNGTTWTRLVPHRSPPDLCHTAMAFDTTSGQLVLFGGFDGTGTEDETWTFSGHTWIRMAEHRRPSDRAGSTMDFDKALGMIVLFGGTAISTSGSQWFAGMDFNDTWEFNGRSWAEVRSGPKPLARWTATMAYVPSLHGLVLFGGVNNKSGDLADTWRLG